MHDAASFDLIPAVRVGDHWLYPDGSSLPALKGGDGEEGAPEGTPPEGGAAVEAPGEGSAPEGEAAPAAPEGQPAEGSEGAEAGEAAPVAEAAPELPAIPEVPSALADVADAALYDQFDALTEALDARRPHAANESDVAVLQEINAERRRISVELSGRRNRTESIAAGLEAVDGEAIEVPERTPAFASAAAVVASAAAPQPEGEATAPAAAVVRPRAVLHASAGTQVAPAGTEINLGQLGRAIDQAKKGGAGETYLAALPSYQDMYADGAAIPEPLDHLMSASRVNELIGESVEDFAIRTGRKVPAMAHVASPGEHRPRTAAICDPLDIIRDIPSQFSTAEPVASTFPSRPVGRLGFQYIKSVSLSAVAAGSTIWDEANQAAVDPANAATWKPIVDVTCPPVTSARAYAVTGALRFDNTTEMSNPERVANFTDALMAVKARNKESKILTRIDQLSGKYTFVGDYGALPTFLKAVNSLVAQMAYADRITEPQYTVYIPRPVATLLGVDRAARGFGQDLTAADVLTEIRAALDGVVEVVETADAGLNEPGYPQFRLQEPGDVEIPVPHLSGEYRVRIVDVMGAIYGETGDLNAGVQRSPELLRQNKAQYFVEEYFILEKHGHAHWATVDVTLCDNGSRAGLITPVACPAVS